MGFKKQKLLFLIQGEGRGHMTQAIALCQLLEKNGHEVAAFLIGTSDQRKIPGFVSQRVSAHIIPIASPNFVTNANKGINYWRTIYKNLRNLPAYFQSLRVMDTKVREYKPDIIINFYDILGGIYNFFYKPSVSFFCIGHQYLMHHPDFIFPEGRRLEKYMMLLHNRITSIGADKLLALSFRKYEKEGYGNIEVVPPLLRQEIKTLSPDRGDYFLAYVVNSGYGEEIIQWHQNNQHVQIYCFWDAKNYPDPYVPHKNLMFYQLNDQKFLQLMQNCKGYISTAGFESVCEAMYLQKPIYLRPVDKHYEQECNALDSQSLGTCLRGTSFHLTDFLAFTDHFQGQGQNFQSWVHQERLFLKALLVEGKGEMVMENQQAVSQI